MSGLEVAGLILGIYPLLTSAVQVFQTTKNGRSAGILLRDLATERVIFEEFVQQLVTPNVSAAERHMLLEQSVPGTGPWLDSSINRKIFARLGTEKTEIVLDLLKDIDSILKHIKNEISEFEHGMVRLVLLDTYQFI
jgi:hypothetical protein